jgi:hypothetical protein
MDSLNLLKQKEIGMDLYMQGFRNHYVWIVIGFILLLVIGLMFWLKPQSANGSMSNQDKSRQKYFYASTFNSPTVWIKLRHIGIEQSKPSRYSD